MLIILVDCIVSHGDKIFLISVQLQLLLWNVFFYSLNLALDLWPGSRQLVVEVAYDYGLLPYARSPLINMSIFGNSSIFIS